MKTIISLTYVVVLIVLGTATFLDNSHGADWSHSHIYGSWWFCLLWVILALEAIAYFLKIKEKRKIVLIIHFSLLVILAGAFVSHLSSRSGTIHLRLNHPQNLVEISHGGNRYLHRLKYDVVLKRFEIIADKEGNPTDFRSEFIINGEMGTVSMNRIFRYGNLRLYQASYDDDLEGSTLIISRDPYGIPITYTGYFLLFASLACLCLKTNVPLKLWVLCGVMTALWCLYYFVIDGSWEYIPVLRSPLLAFHVVTIIIAYMLLLIQAVIGVIWLVRKKKPAHPHIGKHDVALLRTSLLFLALGIFSGAIWANLSWGNYWSWDSKEVWALITFMIYAIPAHRKMFPVFNNPDIYHKFMTAIFVTVLITYFGVNNFLSGMHSYA